MKKTTPKWLLAAVAAGLCLSATGLRADDKDYNKSDATSGAAQSSTTESESLNEAAGAEKGEKTADRKFAEEATKAGMAEAKMGELAQQKAQSQSVKEYGQRLVKDHQEAGQKLKEICEKKHAKSGEAKDKAADLGEHQKAIDHLSSLSGAEFDKAFIDHAVTDHQKCVKKFEKQANEGEDPALRAFARETLPTLQEHLRIAQMLKDNPNASLPTISEPAGAEKKSDAPDQGIEQEDKQQEATPDDQSDDQNQGQEQNKEPLKP